MAYNTVYPNVPVPSGTLDHKSALSGAIIHPFGSHKSARRTGFDAEPSGTSTNTTVHLKHGGNDRTHKLIDAGTVKETRTHRSGFHEDAPPIGNMWMTLESAISIHRFDARPETTHLHGVALTHWQFSDLIDTSTGILPTVPVVMEFRDVTKGSVQPHFLVQNITRGVILPWNFNAAETYTTCPNDSHIWVHYDKNAAYEMKNVQLTFTTTAGNAVTFTNAVLGFKLYLTQWDK